MTFREEWVRLRLFLFLELLNLIIIADELFSISKLPDIWIFYQL